MCRSCIVTAGVSNAFNRMVVKTVVDLCRLLLRLPAITYTPRSRFQFVTETNYLTSYLASGHAEARDTCGRLYSLCIGVAKQSESLAGSERL